MASGFAEIPERESIVCVTTDLDKAWHAAQTHRAKRIIQSSVGVFYVGGNPLPADSIYVTFKWPVLDA